MKVQGERGIICIFALLLGVAGRNPQLETRNS